MYYDKYKRVSTTSYLPFYNFYTFFTPSNTSILSVRIASRSLQSHCTKVFVTLPFVKITIHIFTIYIFALSLVPCGDGGGGIVEIVQHVLEITNEHPTNHEQHSRDCEDDACSAFCICSCCSIALDMPTELPKLTTHLTAISTKISAIFSDFIPTSFHHSVWQPPRFS